MSWVAVGTGHEISIEHDTIVARNAEGRQLASVPTKVRETAEYEQLDQLLSFLHAHDRECGETVTSWLLRGEPVTTRLLAEVWPDEAWRSWLTDLVVSTTDDRVAGFLRAADADGLGIVDPDGETVRIEVDEVLIPHAARLADLDGLRAFAVELGITQRFDQLFRAVFRKPDDAGGEQHLDDWAGAQFEELRFATSRARAIGARVSGGFAVVRVHEDGRDVTAQYWLGADAPDALAITEELSWSVDDETLPVSQVGPVAYSEGVRMASLIHASAGQEGDGQ